MRTLLFCLTFLSCMAFNHKAHAVVFDPTTYGIEPNDKRRPLPDPGLKCEFLRNAIEGKNKVWKCSDGRTLYGPENIWDRPAEATAPKELDADLSIKIENGVLLRVQTFVNDRYCGAGKTKSCGGQKHLSFSYLMTKDRKACEYLGPRLAYQQYKATEKIDSRILVEWFCDGDGDVIPQ